MRVIFAGSPAFAVPSLRRLLATGHEIACVVTQPARPAGRGLVLKDPPVKQFAAGEVLEVHQPKKFNAPEFLDILASKKPDLIVTVAYGRIFKRRALDLPRLGCVNLHASVLPRYRGVAPINWAVINGEFETGVTTFFMEEGVDTGDIILARRTAIGEDENAGELTERLALLGADVLALTCDLIAQGAATHARQDPSLASYAPKLTKENGRITWDGEAKGIHNHIRGVNPWPGAFCVFRSQPLKIIASRLPKEEPALSPLSPGGHEPAASDFSPGGQEPGTSRVASAAQEPGMSSLPQGEGQGVRAGRVIRIDSQSGILVSCSSGSVWLEVLQAPGKKPTGGADFARGYRIKVGDVFG